MSGRNLRRLIYAALFLAIGIVLPLFTGNVPTLGASLLPMHIPVLLCGLICGAGYGAAVGGALPFVRFLLFGVPLLPQDLVSMSVELLIYGLVSGLVYSFFTTKSIGSIYVSLGTAMLLGRIGWGISQKLIFLAFGGADLSFSLFISVAVINALPGIFIQLVIIPAIVSATVVFSKSRGR